MHSAAFQCFSAVSLSQFRFHIFHSTENEDNLPFAHAGLQRWLARLKVDSSLHPADMSEQRSRIAPHLLMTTPNKRPIQKWAVGFFSKTVLVCFVHFCPSPALPQPRLSAALEDFLKQSLGCHGFLLFALKNSVLNLDPHKGGIQHVQTNRQTHIAQAYCKLFWILLVLYCI